VWQFEPPAQPFLTFLRESLEVGKIVHAADHCGQGNEKHLADVVAFGASVSGIGEFLKCLHAGRKFSCILFVPGLFASHSARTIQAVVSHEPELVPE
jgi:hypothetical protein